MRRLLSFIFFSVFIGTIHAYDAEVDGIYYGFIANLPKAYVTYADRLASSYTGEVVVPAQITYGGRTYDVVSVGANAFAGCDELTSVQLPATVRGISLCAFLGCTSLQQVSLPKTVQVVSCFSFTGCTSLQQVIVPRHAELLDSLTFYCCASLTSLVLPHRIRTICQGALEHLPSMTDLYCFASVPPVLEQGAFTLADQQKCTLHVPRETLHLYQEQPVWSDFCQIVALGDEDYKAQDYQKGDINDDGKVDATDLALLQRIIVSLPDDSAVRWAADINADGVVNAVDYVALAKKI